MSHFFVAGRAEMGAASSFYFVEKTAYRDPRSQLYESIKTLQSGAPFAHSPSVMRHQLENLGYVPHPAELHSGQGLDAGQPDGVDVDDLQIGAVLEVETGHTKYVLENRGQGQVLLSGHPQYCPEPVLVKFHGSIGGEALLKRGRIEPGMKMAFQHSKFGTLRTSCVFSVREIKAGSTH